MSGCLSEEDLAAFVAGVGPADAGIDAHLASCRRCRQTALVIASATPAVEGARSSFDGGEAPLVPGAKLGRYTVLEAVGAGSAGVVYAAYDPDLDRKIALKVLRREAGASAAGTRLLFREARALARVSDDHVVHVFDVGLVGEREIVAMEFVEGETLGAWIARARPDAVQIVEVMRQAARGLAAAHAVGLVHRDFKPENVLLSRRGKRLHAKVADFGLAHGTLETWPLQDGDVAPGEDEPRAQARLPLSTIGRRGGFVGMPAYMAPEQARGGEVDARADQFAFSVVLYEALAGVRPHPAQTVAALLAQMADPTFEIDVSRLPISARARRAVLKGMRPDPAARFADLAELVAELRPPARRSGVVRAGAVVALLAASGAAVWATRAARVDPCDEVAARATERFDPARRATLRAAFVATGAPYAEDAWTRVAQRLDERLAAWQRARHDVCVEASSSARSELVDLRTACLSSSLLHTNAFIDTLERADGETVRRAVEAVYALPSLAACEDLERLLDRAPPAPDPEKRARAEALDEALARAQASSFAGKYADADAELGRLVKEAEELGDKPLHAEALRLWGSAAENLASFGAARERYEKSALVALAGKDDAGALAAEAALIPVLAYRFAEAPEAAQWIAQATALAERLGERAHPHDAMLLEAKGIAAYQRGAHAEARDHHRAALALLRQRGEGEAPEVASILLRLAHAERYLGAYDEAERDLKDALELRARLFGDEHPLIAEVRTELGALYTASGKIDEAHAALEQALAVQLAALGPDHLEVAYTINRLGNLELAWGQYDAALARYRRVLELGIAALGEHNTEVGMAHHNLAECLSRLGRLDEAAAEATTASRIVERTAGAKHPYNAMIDAGRGAIARLRGDAEEAERRHRQALAVIEGAGSPNPADVADLTIEIGRDALGARDAARARRLFAEAEAMRPRARMHPLDAVTLDLDVADAARATGDAATATTRVAAARDALRAMRPGSDGQAYPRVKALLERADAAAKK